jgi:hypothetical protein
MMPISGSRAARYRTAIFTVAVGAMLVVCSGRGAAWAATNNKESTRAAHSAVPTAPQRSQATTPMPVGPSLVADYAEREASAPDLQNFQGGDVVIVGTTGVIVVLLLVIILLSL